MHVEERRGKWRARLRLKGQPQISKTFHSKEAAEQWGREMQDAASSGRLAEHVAADLTLDEVLAEYAKKVTPFKRGALQEQGRIRRLRETPLAGLKLSALTRAVLRAHRDKRTRTITGACWNRELSLIAQALRYARAELDAAIDPAELVTGLRGKESPHRERVLSDEEESRLLAAAPAIGPLMAPLVILLIETGLRRGELVAARREHVQGNRLLVPTSKNNRPRTIVLTPRALAALQRLPARLDGLLIDWDADLLTGRFRRCVRAAGIAHATVHDLRHTAITRWVLRSGLSVAQARSMSGHRTLSAFTRYLNVDTDALAQIEQRLAA